MSQSICQRTGKIRFSPTPYGWYRSTYAQVIRSGIDEADQEWTARYLRDQALTTYCANPSMLRKPKPLPKMPAYWNEERAPMQAQPEGFIDWLGKRLGLRSRAKC